MLQTFTQVSLNKSLRHSTQSSKAACQTYLYNFSSFQNCLFTGWQEKKSLFSFNDESTHCHTAYLYSSSCWSYCSYLTLPRHPPCHMQPLGKETTAKTVSFFALYLSADFNTILTKTYKRVYDKISERYTDLGKVSVKNFLSSLTPAR